MTGNLKLLCNFVEKFLVTVHFRNGQFAPILGYGDLNQGNVTIKQVYYVEGLNHNLFLVGQFCDVDFEVAFRKSTCFVRDLQGNDLLTGNLGSDLYPISLQETTSSTPSNMFNAKASNQLQACLSKLKYVKDQLCLSCEMSKAKRSSFKSKAVPSSKGRLNYLLHNDLCWSMRVVRISQKSQENSQKRASTDTESEEYKKKPRNQSRSQKSQASVKSSQRKVNHWSTKVNKTHNIPF
ncbi:hypothetical protein Tco_0237305 [Tanacetum coccineum]